MELEFDLLIEYMEYYIERMFLNKTEFKDRPLFIISFNQWKDFYVTEYFSDWVNSPMPKKFNDFIRTQYAS